MHLPKKLSIDAPSWNGNSCCTKKQELSKSDFGALGLKLQTLKHICVEFNQV